MIVALPTNDGRTPTIVFFPNDAFHEVRADIEGHFMRVLDLVPQLAEQVRNGKHSERFLGTADLPFFFWKSYDPGWALVGNAGYHKDPITAQGKGLEDALAFLRPGDTLVVWKLDRAGRSLAHLMELLKDLQHREISFVSLTEQVERLCEKWYNRAEE
jgi:hypothetical protein